jgi:hypothetical protein
MSTIIAIDLGRHKSVACVCDRGSGAHAFRELDTTPGALDRLLAGRPGASRGALFSFGALIDERRGSRDNAANRTGGSSCPFACYSCCSR